MTESLDRAIELARRMPPETQDAIARLVMELADEADPEPVSAEDAEAIAEGLAQADRGEFATDEEVEAALRRFRD